MIECSQDNSTEVTYTHARCWHLLRNLNDVHFSIITLHYEETEMDKQLREGISQYEEGPFSQGSPRSHLLTSPISAPSAVLVFSIGKGCSLETLEEEGVR